MKIKQRENFPVYGTLCILVWHINFEAAITCMLQISIFYCLVNCYKWVHGDMLSL